ncbi:UDP-N-acetylmuramate dehydrogenase [Anaerotruncus colihominis]|uniref:UDP-N-acetylenolpyruvoylglucosamine reductase n=1 Tax=Anaerotruncus colihominis TaxID=169435 RepID=A0A845SNJ3_9FIRM|nr:UDP-N-acetylmuramate dehydrogenase [Anaerotruncus colihominis]MCR2025869.1 UDP-N-acetylmuramate dehydrogenase [Anaerotruncus colihominis]NDO38579.1 UDP-N-acetylmuramate dehydrogenase [Anaerotruncus colihominis]
MNKIAQLQKDCERIGCVCLADEPMAAHTSFKIGGPADLLLKPKDVETAARVVARARELSVPLLFIGKGSDLLICDEGVRGAVLSFDEESARPSMCDETVIDCPAGASLTTLCRFALEQGLTGLEFAYGIPGSVGGAVYMNAGAYGGEICDVVGAVRFLDGQGKLCVLEGCALELSYRHSYFTDHPDCLITSASFHLKRGDREAIRARMDDLMERRRTKQPLEYPSAGSTFKRPKGAYASALIDGCGLKGRRVGGAMVSEKHAGFVINYDNASCTDVLTLIGEIQTQVREQTGFSLECEVKYIG